MPSSALIPLLDTPMRVPLPFFLRLLGSPALIVCATASEGPAIGA